MALLFQKPFIAYNLPVKYLGVEIPNVSLNSRVHYSEVILPSPALQPEHELVNLLRSPGIDSQPGVPVRQPYLT
jgi:hypothetical protein